MLDTPCCMYGHDCGFEVHPKGGVWTLRNVYDILSDCQADEVLKGARMNTLGCEGGFAWPGTRASEELWRRNTSPSPAQVPPMTDDDTEYGPRQIRTYGVRGAFLERNRGGGRGDEDAGGGWRSLPTASDFDKPCEISTTFQRGVTSVPAFHCRAKRNVSLGHVVSLLRLFRARGHTVLSTTGFKMDTNFVDVTALDPKSRKGGSVHPLVLAPELRKLWRPPGHAPSDWKKLQQEWSRIQEEYEQHEQKHEKQQEPKSSLTSHQLMRLEHQHQAMGAQEERLRSSVVAWMSAAQPYRELPLPMTGCSRPARTVYR